MPHPSRAVAPGLPINHSMATGCQHPHTGATSSAVSPGWVRGTGLVPEPKQGKEKQRKLKSEPAKGLCKAAEPGPGCCIRRWDPAPFPGLGDTNHGMGDPAGPHRHGCHHSCDPVGWRGGGDSPGGRDKDSVWPLQAVAEHHH